jgi:hypothetical protein
VADVRVIEAIYRSISPGAPVMAEPGGGEAGDALAHRQGMKVPAHPRPELFQAEAPSS